MEINLFAKVLVLFNFDHLLNDFEKKPALSFLIPL